MTGDGMFRALFESPHDAIFVATSSGQIVDINYTACKMLDYTRAELLDRNAATLLPPADRQRLLAIFNSPGKETFIGHQIRKDGTPVLLEARSWSFMQDGTAYTLVSAREMTNAGDSLKKVNQQQNYLTSLHEISLGLLNELDIDALLHHLLDQACELFGTTEGYICLRSKTPGLLETRIGAGVYAKMIGYTYTIGGKSALANIAQNGRPLIIENYQNWPERHPDPQWDKIRTTVGIPLKHGEKVIGVIGLDFNNTPRSFFPEEELLLSRFADLASIALVNASLHSSLVASEAKLIRQNEDLTVAHEELLATEEELRHQFNELMINEEEIRRHNIVLTSLHEMALGLMQELDPEEVLNMIVASATDLMDTPDGFIKLLDERQGQFIAKVAAGFYARYPNDLSPITAGLLGQAYTTGQTVVTADYSADENRLPEERFDAIHGFVAIPLKAGEKVTGVFGLSYDDPSRAITKHELPLLQRFADLASIALDHATHVQAYKQELQERRQVEEALRASEEKYRAIFDSANDLIYLHDATTFEILDVNRAACEGYGFTRDELMTAGCSKFGTGEPPYSQSDAEEWLRLAAAGTPQRLEWQTKSPKRDTIWEDVHLEKMSIGNRECILAISRDISERKKNELELRKSEANNLALINAIPDPMLVFNRDGILVNWKGSPQQLSFIPGRAADKTVFELFPPEVAPKIMQGIALSLELGTTQVFEFQLNDQAKKEYFEARIIASSDEEVLAIIRNITDRKLMELQLEHLSLHDALTGLYNRAYFEEHLKRLEAAQDGSVALLMCDIDGLKIINDTLGHNMGDIILKAVADIVRGSFRPTDLVARVGGDEFAVLLPHNSAQKIEADCRHVREKIERYNTGNPTVPISLSLGFAISCEAESDFNALFKEADNNMYREKLHRHQSARSAIVQALIKALEARDFITEGHGDRLQDLMVAFAKEMGLPEQNISDLRLLARFHDVGKVGILDSILFKPGRLTEKEFAVMRQHCEIGYRIADSTPDMAPIADWILKHQEWWNGEGYPLQLAGEDIPLACRMLAIVDAYDAMTSDRPYRRAMSRAAAIAEIQRCVGTQFDPKLVASFVAMIIRPRTSRVSQY